jgi:hypothetical protein
VPADDSVWLDDGQVTAPIRENVRQYSPLGSIRRPKPGPLGVSLQDLELMAKGDVLEGELAMGSKRRCEHEQDVFEHNRGYRPKALSR